MWASRPMAYRANASEDLGKLLLRLALAVLILLHGVDKLMHGPGFILGLLQQVNIPPVLGYLVYVGEVLAPLLLILGIWTRLAALAVALHMVAAIWLVHTKELLQLGQGGGWALELQGLYLLAALAVALLGAGRYSATGTAGRFN